MNKKELILKEIINYYDNNKLMPTIRYLMKKFNYHSTNIVYRYLKMLEVEGSLKRNNQNKLILNKEYQSNIKEILVINSKDKVKLVLEKDKRYLGYKVLNNLLLKDNIIKGDILIIEICKRVSNKGLGLFKINNNYLVGNYEIKDNLFVIDYENTIVCDINDIVGRVVMLYRNVKKNH